MTTATSVRLVEDEHYSLVLINGSVLEGACFDKVVICRQRGAIAIFYTDEGKREVPMAEIADIVGGDIAEGDR